MNGKWRSYDVDASLVESVRVTMVSDRPTGSPSCFQIAKVANHLAAQPGLTLSSGPDGRRYFDSNHGGPES